MKFLNCCPVRAEEFFSEESCCCMKAGLKCTDMYYLQCENMASYDDDDDALGNDEDENVEFTTFYFRYQFCICTHTHSGGSHPLDITAIVLNNQQLLTVLRLTWRSSHDLSKIDSNEVNRLILVTMTSLPKTIDNFGTQRNHKIANKHISLCMLSTDVYFIKLQPLP